MFQQVSMTNAFEFMVANMLSKLGLFCCFMVAMEWKLNLEKTLRYPKCRFFFIYFFIFFLFRNKKIFENDARFDLKKIKRIKTMIGWEKHFGMKLLGHTSLDEYHKYCNLDSKIHLIKVPTLFLNASDDMFSPLKGKNVVCNDFLKTQTKLWYNFENRKFSSNCIG